MKWITKIKGGSLQFVLFIGAVIVVLLLTFVLLSHMHIQFSKKSDTYIETIKQADLALEMALNNPNGGLVGSRDLSQKGIKTAIVKERWGLFDLYRIDASFQKTQFTKMALVGTKRAPNDAALYLKDNQHPMIIVGHACIKGDAYLPNQGIRPGNIAGQSFYGNTPVHGKQKRSNSALPPIAGQPKNSLEQWASPAFIPIRSNRLNGLQANELVHSFLEPPLIVWGEVLQLAGKKITGNVVLKADYRIVVSPTTLLNDVILVAPEIVIQDGVTGSFQAIASKTITVGKNCLLHYPSVLAVFHKESRTDLNQGIPVPNIQIQNNSSLKGIIGYWEESREQKQRYHPQIRIDAGATVIGQVYCEKHLELKGSVHGNVTTDSFVALKNGSIYQNHLFQGKIDAGALPLQYVGLGYGQQGKGGVAKWLY